MGCINSHPPTPSEEAMKHRQIEREIYQQQKRNKKEVILLMLGAGGTGKSTFAKQMRIMFNEHLVESQREMFVAVIDAGLIGAIDSLLFVASSLDVSLSDSTQKSAENFQKLQMPEEEEGKEEKEEEESEEEEGKRPICGPLGDVMLQIWNDFEIQRLYENRHLQPDLSSLEFLNYFFGRFEVVKKKDYLPSFDDILRIRSKTTGIAEVRVTADGTPFCFVDVGGQRTERKKWLHCFQNVTAVLFFVALNDYYQILEEDGSTNRLFESIRLFKDLRHSVWFEDKPILIFFNKTDLLQNAVLNFDYRQFDPGFDGDPKDYEQVTQSIIDQFIQETNSPSPLYQHITCAVDTAQIRLVFDTVRRTVLGLALESSF